MNSHPIDQTAREAAISERQRNVILDAGAGTGKTTTLVRRLVHMLAPGDGDDWAQSLAAGGRTALSPVLEQLSKSSESEHFERVDFDPLDEVWLVHADPIQTPEVELEEERQRRRQVTKEFRLSGDLLIPERFRELDLSRLAESHIPAHRECAAFAQNPDGVLSLDGEFHSALGGVLWCIARHWFVDRLVNVRAFDWHVLVYDNVMAQDRANWNISHAVLYHLWPVHLEDDSLADPGYAERLLEYRLVARLPTVLAFERIRPDHLNLRSSTVRRLDRAWRITLPRLSAEEQKRIGLEL